jgi:release factor glutamine methyltransferase
VVKQPFSSESMRPTIAEVLREGEVELAASSASARLDSEVLLRYVLNVSQSGLIIAFREECPKDIHNRFRELIERRKRSEPIAYIIGEREFWGLAFRVTPDVLVPRPESELLVEQAVKELRGRDSVRIADLGTGSGCIAIALVRELKAQGCGEISCDAIDLSDAALVIARENAARHEVASHIRFVRGSWFRELRDITPPYDCIVANPPYIDPEERTPPELSFEPRQALFSADRGLADTAEILRTGLPLLTPDGVLLCEVGAGKGPIIDALVAPYSGDRQVGYLGDTSTADRFRVVRIARNS